MKIKSVRLGDLAPAGYNPRQIGKKAMVGLAASISRWGLVEPIILNERTGRIVGGHQRWRVLVERDGIDAETQVVCVDLGGGEEKALNVTLNNAAITGDFTVELEGLLGEIEEGLGEGDYAELCYGEIENEMFGDRSQPIKIEDIGFEDAGNEAAGDLFYKITVSRKRAADFEALCDHAARGIIKGVECLKSE